jgi:hypothetical protein
MTSALVSGKWSVSRHGNFTPRKGYLLNRRLAEPQSRCGRCGKEINLALPGIEFGPFILWPVAISTELSLLINNNNNNNTLYYSHLGEKNFT